MAEMTPFETTPFLDADTVVLGDLELGFQLGQAKVWPARFANALGHGDTPVCRAT